MDDLLLLVHRHDVFLQTTVVPVLNLNSIFASEIAHPDLQPGVQESSPAHSGVDLLEIELYDVTEDGHIGLEVDGRTSGVGFTGRLQGGLALASDVLLTPHLAFSVDSHRQPFRDGVDSTHSDAV